MRECQGTQDIVSALLGFGGAMALIGLTIVAVFIAIRWADRRWP